MATKRKARKSTKKARKFTPRIAKHVTMGGATFGCYTKRVKNARGKKTSLRGYCRKNKKK